MTSIKHDSVVALIGMCNTGKTVLVKDLLHHQPTLPAGTVVSYMRHNEREYNVPNMVMYDEYSPSIISNVLERQKCMSQEDPRNALILDDCLYDYTWTHDENMRSLFINRRHNNTLFILTMLYGMCIPLALSKNIDYVFILREMIVSNRRRLYDYYAGVFPDFDTFCQAMNQYAAEEFVCLVIDNTSTSMNWEDKVFWYKADYHPAIAAVPRSFFSVSISKSNVRSPPHKTPESAPQEVRHDQNQA